MPNEESKIKTCSHIVGFHDLNYDGGSLVYKDADDWKDTIDKLTSEHNKENDYYCGIPFNFCPMCGVEFIGEKTPAP